MVGEEHGAYLLAGGPRRQRGVVSKLQMKLTAKHAGEKRKHTSGSYYGVDNVVGFGGKSTVPNWSLAGNASSSEPTISIPQYKTLDAGYYHAESVDESQSPAGREDSEDEREERYEKMHLPRELSESCGHFLNCGQEVPAEFRDGLLVRLRLK